MIEVLCLPNTMPWSTMAPNASTVVAPLLCLTACLSDYGTFRASQRPPKVHVFHNRIHHGQFHDASIVTGTVLHLTSVPMAYSEHLHCSLRGMRGLWVYTKKHCCAQTRIQCHISSALSYIGAVHGHIGRFGGRVPVGPVLDETVCAVDPYGT